MNCPICGNDVKVIGSKRDCEAIYRKRRCLDKDCDYIFFTAEYEADVEDDYNELQREYGRARKNYKGEK